MDRGVSEETVKGFEMLHVGCQDSREKCGDDADGSGDDDSSLYGVTVVIVTYLPSDDYRHIPLARSQHCGAIVSFLMKIRVADA